MGNVNFIFVKEKGKSEKKVFVILTALTFREIQ